MLGYFIDVYDVDCVDVFEIRSSVGLSGSPLRCLKLASETISTSSVGPRFRH